MGARDQWLLYSRIVDNWGLHKLAAKLLEESAEEAVHARTLIERMVFLEKLPTMRPIPVSGDETLTSMFAHSLELELTAVSDYRALIEECSPVDPVTRGIGERHLAMEEGHVNWLEEQMYLMEKMGEKLYMESQT